MEDQDKKLQQNTDADSKPEQGTDDKNKTQQHETPDFTEDQQKWINDFVSKTKAQAKEKMEEYKKQVDSTIDDKINEKVAEQQRRAKMTADERVAEDKKRLEEENRKLKDQIAYNDRLSYGRSIAAQYNVPSSMVERLVGADNEETETNMKSFAEAFNSAVQQGVDKRLAGTGQPQQGTQVNLGKDTTLDDLSLEKQTELFQKNPDLYRQLANR